MNTRDGNVQYTGRSNIYGDSSGSAKVWIIVVLLFIIVVSAGIWLLTSNNQSIQSRLNNLESQIAQIESKYESASPLSDQDTALLADLEKSVKVLQDGAIGSSQDIAESIADLSRRIDVLGGGITGESGAGGAQGAAGPQGIPGPQGVPGSNDCLQGICVSRQATNGTPETGNINITGGIIAATLQGNGADVTNVDSATLQGNTASYFTNATNLASGTIADARLGTNVALLNTDQTFTGTILLSTAGTALTITNTASIGTLAVVTSANIGGSLAVIGGVTSASLSVTGTVSASSYTITCTPGYVPVPGNPKFGTNDFCVMKYEAKNDGGGNAVSTATGTPYVSISQRDAQDKSIAAGGHLITEAEWMTIATNALWVNANWCNLDGTSCGNAPGTAGKYLTAGHNDGTPNAALAATSDDNDACYGTVTADVSTACGAAGAQKRTLTLSNGSVIWDIPGNVWDWTDSWINQNEQPSVDTITDGTAAYREYTTINQYKGLQYINPTNRSWNSTQRIGQIYSYSNSTTTAQRGFNRGGYWTDDTIAGAFALLLQGAPTELGGIVGFRVAK